MFVLLVVKDTVAVAPKTFDLPASQMILDSLNKKCVFVYLSRPLMVAGEKPAKPTRYANKLIPDKGLALSVFDILTAEDGKVTWGNGMMYYKVSIRLMLFAPFHSEVIVGKVVESTPSYVRISLGFFKDIYIPLDLMPPNTTYDITQNLFFWYSGDEEDRTLSVPELLSTVVAQRLYLHVGEPIRFRVDSIEWQDVRPDPPIIHEPGTEVKEDTEGEGIKKDPYKSAGFRILGTIAESGLGLVSWWDGSGGDEEEEDAME